MINQVTLYHNPLIVSTARTASQGVSDGKLAKHRKPARNAQGLFLRHA